MPWSKHKAAGAVTRRHLLSGLLGLAGAGIPFPTPARGGFPQRSTSRAEGKIGDIQVFRVLETVIHVDAGTWFPGVDAQILAPYLDWLVPTHYDPATNAIPMFIQSWVLRYGGRTVLIDTGFGNGKDRSGYKGADRLDTPYMDRLKDVGVEPEDVDVVICTHLHLDHVGWNTRFEKDRWVPAFPKARYLWLAADEADCRNQLTNPATPAFVRQVYADSVAPIIQGGQSMPLQEASSLDDHIHLRPAPGHSPGTLRVEVQSRGERAIFAGDMLHAALQVPLWDYSSAGDTDRAQAAKARFDLLKDCAETGALLVPAHFPAPHVGHVRIDGERFKMDFGWQRNKGAANLHLQSMDKQER